MSNLTIVFADDHPLYRQSLIAAVKRMDAYQGCICLEAGNGLDILRHLRKQPVDMVVTDIGMPEMDGMQALQKIKENFPAVKVIIVSQYDDLAYASEAVKLHVNGYLLKNRDIEEVIACFDIVIKGGFHFDSQLLVKLEMSTKASESSSVPANISGKPEKILRLLCEEYSNEEIAEMLGISVSTVKTHRNNLYVKTKSKTVIGLVIYAIKHNLFHLK